ncbi:5-formyltetrahydrofolate cyclo-ligase [Clostridia bacterium OttesenSCG-928-F22]|nr:5-formyltetrahydrofolate cyclo-ligase [Clostridia bacterium OttesenSCG-928-F22]
MNVNEEKKALRAEFIDRRNSMEADEVQQHSKVILCKLLRLPQYQMAEKVFVYLSAMNEPDTFTLIREALMANKQVYVPVCVSKSVMCAQKIVGFESLKKGAYGIYEPDYDESRTVSADEIEFAIVPGVAFDKGLERLGFGARYYDEFLRQADGAFRAGIAHDWQVVDKLPLEAHDEPMHAIITERGMYTQDGFMT